MKLIINTTNIVVGGAIQVATSFFQELKFFGSHDYHIFLSQEVAKQIQPNLFPENFKFYFFENTPARLIYRRKITQKLNKLEAKIKPNVIFTLFGPSYWRPRAIHLMGFALGWAISPESIAYTQIGRFEYIKMKLSNAYKKFYIVRDGDFLIGETKNVKKRLVKYGFKDKNHIFIVGNTYNSVFNGNYEKYYIPKIDNSFKFITISAYYPHKNLQILREIIPYLKMGNVKCQFYLTLPKNQFDRFFGGFEDWIINLGPVPIDACPSIYQQCDALFLPTLLESFSASYPESMKMDLPILTSNIDFAKAICADAAEYFNPLDPKIIAQIIQRIIKNKQRRNELISLGRIRLKSFPTARQRAEMYLDICRSLCSLNKK